MPRTPKPPPSPRVPDIDRECDECVDRLSDELEHVLLPLAVERRLFDAGTTDVPPQSVALRSRVRQSL